MLVATRVFDVSMVKYRRPTSVSRVGQDMRHTWGHVIGNLATLVLLPPRDGPTATTTENGEKPPPLPPRGPSRASPYAGLGK